MKKKIIVATVIAALMLTLLVVPHVSFAESGSYGETVSNFQSALQNLKSETDLLKTKIATVKSLSKDIHETLKEMKANGKEIPSAAKEDLKKAKAIRHIVEKERDIRDARSFYAKSIIKKMRDLRKKIAEKKKSGASKEELKPLIKQIRALREKLRNVAPLSPKVMLKNSDKVLKRAESLKNNGKEKEAIKLLDAATNRCNKTAQLVKNRIEKTENLINLLNKIKGELNE